MNIIETRRLTKRFGNMTANDGIDFAVKQGEIHAIIGENGAGKSTLMNMLYGLLQPDEGEIYIRGQKTRITSPKVAIQLGIGMVHQHFKLVPSITIAENILLSSEPIKSGFIDKKKSLEIVERLIREFGFVMNPKDRIRDVSVGVQQRVEILKMLYRDVDILILDEPTAVLTPQEVDELLVSLRHLKNKGKTIIIITHKLGEVKRCSDTVTVIRHGKVVNTVKTSDVEEKDLANMMVGRDVLLRVEKQERRPGNVIYEVKGLSTKDNRGVKVVDNVSFHVREGEIVGFAGVEGNGQSELMKILSGLWRATEGSVTFMGRDITNAMPRKLRELGIGIVPEDRYEHGSCKTMTIAENLIAGYHYRKPFTRWGFLRSKEITAHAERLKNRFDVRAATLQQHVGSLSGGNAQKVIIARELSMNPKVLIVSQPTRGVDIGSIEFIHQQIIKSRDEGKAVILISSELSEIMNLSDRILVMYKGSVIGEFPAKDVTQEKLGYLMAGIP